MRRSPNSSFIRAGSEIASPRAPISKGHTPYRKQLDWQIFVDELSAEHDRVRDTLKRELRQMQDLIVELREEQANLELSHVSQQSALECKLENKSKDVESLHEELQVSKTREIHAKRALDLNEANNAARCSEMEATIARLQQAAVADAKASATKALILQTQLESTKACEEEAHHAIANAREDVAEMNQRSSEALLAMQSEQIKVKESAALAEAASMRECEQLEATSARSQRALEKVQADSRLQQQQFEAKIASIQARESETRDSENSLQQSRLELQQQLEVQRNEGRLDLERSKKKFSSKYQLLEARMKEEEFACQKKIAEQQSVYQQEMEKHEESFYARCQQLQAEVDEEKSACLEKLQVQQQEAARAANVTHIAYSSKCQQMEARAERAAAELKRQRVRTEEEIQMNSLLAENEVAIAESSSSAKNRMIEEALHSSEQTMVHVEKSGKARQETLKAELQASHDEVTHAKHQVALEETIVATKCQKMEEQVVSSEMMVIDAKHEIACARAASHAQCQQLEAALDHAHQAVKQTEQQASVRYRDLESQMSMMQRRDMTTMRSLEHSETLVAERCSNLEAQAQRNQSLEIQAECVEAESLAKAEANHRGLEAVVDQMLWDIGREEHASNTKVERLEADLISARAEAVAARETLALQEERFRAGTYGPRSRRQFRRTDGVPQNVDRSAKVRMAGKGALQTVRQARTEGKTDKDSPEAGGG